MYNGLELNVNARLRNGLQLQAGSNTGQRVTDYCEVRAKLPEQTGGFSTGSEVPAYSPVNPYCHFAPGITPGPRPPAPTRSRRSTCCSAATFPSSPGIPLAAD